MSGFRSLTIEYGFTPRYYLDVSVDFISKGDEVELLAVVFAAAISVASVTVDTN